MDQNSETDISKLRQRKNINSVTFAQLSLDYFDRASTYIKPKHIKNAQDIIDWAGGIENVVTLTGDKAPIEELVFDAGNRRNR